MRKLIKFGLAGLSIVLLSFSLYSCNASNNVINQVENKELQSKLAGMWILKSINGVSAADAFKGPVPTLNFDFAQHKVAGTGGCNNFNGGFGLAGNLFVPGALVTTMKACAHENQEAELLKLLGQRSTLVLNNYALQFVQNGKVVLEYTPRAR